MNHSKVRLILHLQALFLEMNAAGLSPRHTSGRHCWLVSPTNLTFNFYLLVVFLPFSRESCGILYWNFPRLSLGVVLSSHGSNVIDFSCAIFTSKHVNAMISHKTYIYIKSHCVNGYFFSNIPTGTPLTAVRGGGSRWNIAMPFDMEKLERCGYTTVKKFVYVYSFWQNVRTWRTHTHTQTPHDGKGRAWC